MKRAFCLRLIAVICIQLLCLASIARAAEVRLGVAPNIKLPEGSPTYSEELMNFFGNNAELLGSPNLKARVFKNHAQDLPQGSAESIRIQVTRIPQTSILLVKATGPDESVCVKYLAVLVHEFLAFKTEEKRKHYDAAIQRVKVALEGAKNDATQTKALTNYLDQLGVAARLDTLPVFELWPEP